MQPIEQPGTGPDDITPELIDWLRQAYDVA